MPEPSPRHREDLAFSRVTEADLEEATDVVAQGMAQNPLHVAAYGRRTEDRVARHRRLVRAAFDLLPQAEPVAARLGERIVAVAASTPTGHCRPSQAQRLRLLPRVMALGPRPSRQVLQWLRTWEQHDPDVPHVHIGPVAVHPNYQGAGIGSALMSSICRDLDRTSSVGYLETDKPRNLDFYRRLGFEVTDQALVIGVPNWFMTRWPTDSHPSGALDSEPDGQSHRY